MRCKRSGMQVSDPKRHICDKRAAAALKSTLNVGAYVAREVQFRGRPKTRALLDVLGCLNKVEAFMSNLFSRFVRDESGATAIEYGLIAALISVVIIAAVTLLGTKLSATFQAVAAALT
jgi:pilus assembly protein Flp/PilA